MKSLLFLALVYATSAFSQGHDHVGNGEIVVICNGKVELAEYHEASVISAFKDKFKMIDSPAPVDDQVKMAFEKLTAVTSPKNQRANAEKLYKDYLDLKNKINWIEGDYEWNFTDDLGPFPRKKDCQLKNVVNYFDQDFVEGQKELYEALTNSEKAALWVHELIYKYTRSASRQKTSLPARRIVTILFSDLDRKGLLEGLNEMYMGYDGLNLKNRVEVKDEARKITVEAHGEGGLFIEKSPEPKYYLQAMQKPHRKNSFLGIYELQGWQKDTLETIFLLGMNMHSFNPGKTYVTTQYDEDGNVLSRVEGPFGRYSPVSKTSWLVLVPSSVSKFIRGNLD